VNQITELSCLFNGTRRRGSSVGIATGFELDGPGLIPESGKRASRPALEPIERPIDLVSEVLPSGVKRPGREADH
jgi:hypothetical protein